MLEMQQIQLFFIIKSTSCVHCFVFMPISGRVDRASSAETVDWSSIPDRVKPKTIKIGIHSFPA